MRLQKLIFKEKDSIMILNTDLSSLGINLNMNMPALRTSQNFSSL